MVGWIEVDGSTSFVEPLGVKGCHIAVRMTPRDEVSDQPSCFWTAGETNVMVTKSSEDTALSNLSDQGQAVCRCRPEREPFL